MPSSAHCWAISSPAFTYPRTPRPFVPPEGMTYGRRPSSQRASAISSMRSTLDWPGFGKVQVAPSRRSRTMFPCSTRMGSPLKTRRASSPQAAAAAAVMRQWFDCAPPIVMSVSAPSASAWPRWNSSLRALLPPSARPVWSSRLIHRSTPAAAERRGARTSGVGTIASGCCGSFAKSTAARSAVIAAPGCSPPGDAAGSLLAGEPRRSRTSARHPRPAAARLLLGALGGVLVAGTDVLEVLRLHRGEPVRVLLRRRERDVEEQDVVLAFGHGQADPRARRDVHEVLRPEALVPRRAARPVERLDLGVPLEHDPELVVPEEGAEPLAPRDLRVARPVVEVAVGDEPPHAAAGLEQPRQRPLFAGLHLVRARRDLLELLGRHRRHSSPRSRSAARAPLAGARVLLLRARGDELAVARAPDDLAVRHDHAAAHDRVLGDPLHLQPLERGEADLREHRVALAEHGLAVQVDEHEVGVRANTQRTLSRVQPDVAGGVDR